jgi:subtilisin family serine protease
MQQLIVTVNKLNKRSTVPPSLPDPKGIIGTVNKNFSFFGTEADPGELPNSSTGKWFKDRDGSFYWGGGLEASDIQQTEVRTSVVPVKVSVLDKDKKDWGFIDYDIDKLWTYSKGKNIKLALLDSGLNYSLEDFKHNTNILFYNACMNSHNMIDCRDDPSGHGTDCAGILCGQGIDLWGISPEISLSVIKITDNKGAVSVPAIYNAMEMAARLNVDVISMNVCIPGNVFAQKEMNDLHTKIIAAFNQNITIVAPASEGTQQLHMNGFPASFPECLATGAVDNNKVQVSANSDFLDLVAPGKNVFSLTNQDETGNGADFAAPFVAGVVALLKSIAKNKNLPLSNIQLFDILKRSADINFKDYNKAGYGSGIINPVAALQLMLGS